MRSAGRAADVDHVDVNRFGCDGEVANDRRTDPAVIGVVRVAGGAKDSASFPQARLAIVSRSLALTFTSVAADVGTWSGKSSTSAMLNCGRDSSTRRSHCCTASAGLI